MSETNLIDMYLQPPWQPIATAPLDGTLVLLLIETDNGIKDHALEDTTDPTPTIGFNSLANTQVDKWDIAGWNWSQDVFTEGRGKPIAWAPIPNWEASLLPHSEITPPPAASHTNPENKDLL